MREPIRLQPHQTLREILAIEPRTSRIFEVWNVDYYCGGNQTLAETCARSGFALEELQTSVNRLRDNSVDFNEELEWYTATLTELTDHIIRNHHAYLRSKLPELLDLAKKVAEVHMEDHPETSELLRVLAALKDVLEPHLAKEEEKLFPMLCGLEKLAKRQCDGQPDVPPLSKTLPLVLAAHNHNGGLLNQIRKITNDFRPPEDACYSFQRLLKGLQNLEKDMHRHLHLENNILFPRAEEYEERIIESQLGR